MSQLDDLIVLLLLPEPGEATVSWLQAAARNLQGYRPQPSVIRRSRTVEGIKAEARRWTREAYLPLTSPGPARHTLAMCSDGRLMLCRLEGMRHLRRRPGDVIDDEIYEFLPLDDPTEEQLEVVRERVLRALSPLGYRHWGQLGPEHRLSLARFGGSWQEAAEALAEVDGPDRVESLQLFLGPDAEDGLRREVQTAGHRGDLRPGVDVLAWLLAQPDWNLQPGLVAMARSAVDDEPDRAWELHRHPNPQVRLRLADLHQGEADRVGWLAIETDDAVRDRILRALERRHAPSDLVDLLLKEKDPVRREALGWALVHWSGRIQSNHDWMAMNRALFTRMGPENRARLKDKLARMGRLGLRARLLG